MDNRKLTVVFELERDTLLEAHLHQGPPVWVKSRSFLDKWRRNAYGDPFIRNGRWNVIAARQYTDAAEMLSKEAGRSGIGKEIDLGTMRILGHGDTLSSVDPVLITKLLSPRLPWENRVDTLL